MSASSNINSYKSPVGAKAWFTEPWRTHKAARYLLFGVISGFGIPALVVALLATTGMIELARSDLTVSVLLATLFSAAIISPIFEEAIFRYLLFRGVEKFLGSWIALGTTGLLFGLAHLMFSAPASLMEGALIAVAGTLAGIFFAAGYLATRTLWLPIGLHAGWNMVTNVLIGPDSQGANRAFWLRPEDPIVLSGGSFGSDASIITSGFLLVAIVLLLGYARKKGRIAFSQTQNTK